MKFEITYYDSSKSREQTIKLTGISGDRVKANFISQYSQKQYPFISIRPI